MDSPSPFFGLSDMIDWSSLLGYASDLLAEQTPTYLR